MRLIKSKNAEENYLSKIVRINEFRKHNDPEVTRLKCCTIGGYNMITGIDSEPGLYVYFPALSQINSDFLSYANLYRHKELNSDPEQSGMFEDNGRVKAIRLRGELSEGFIIPLQTLQNYIISVTNKELNNVEEGTEFDSVEDSGKEFWISKKYIVQRQQTQGSSSSKPRGKVPKRLNKVRDDQFRFHYTTVQIKKCPFILAPDSLIHMSYKMHGTSTIHANVLCHRELNWKQKIAKWLTGETFDHYDYIYSSRTVIKNPYYNPQVGQGYYSEDIWAEADKIIKPKLTKGMTVYAEILGFLPNGQYIQKGYDYGCVPPKSNEEFTHEKHFKIRVYRVTMTNVDGVVTEFTPLQVEQWCEKVGLTPVETCYFGKAKDLYPDIDTTQHWNENFIDRLANDKNFYMELDSPHCKNKVPHEGVVIKPLERLGSAFKLKSFRFLDKEGRLADLGESNIEDEA